MAFLKRKNNRFEYNPRYYKGDGNPYQIKHKFDQFRNSTKKNVGLKEKLTEAINELRGEQKSIEFENELYESEKTQTNSNKIILFIIALLVFVFLFIIDFDLSIFSRK